MDIYQPTLPDSPPRHPMLADIARELTSEVVFPTGLDTIARLHAAIERPDISLAEVGALITVEPLVCARVLALANSVAYNPAGAAIQTLPKAIERLGVGNVRTVALAVLAKQLLQTREAAAFREIATRIWAHSLHTASAAYVVARRLTRVHPDEALLAGLIHDIGACYMVHRGARYNDLVARPTDLVRLIADWHESIGHTLAITLGLPKPLCDAILDQDTARDWPDPVFSLNDIVYVANAVAGGGAHWEQRPLDLPGNQGDRLRGLIDQLGNEIDTHRQLLTASLG